MGRLAARVLLARESELGLELVHVNEKVGGADMAAYLLQFDSTHGSFPNKICMNDGADGILVRNPDASGDSKRIRYTRAGTPEEIPWGETGVELVFECTGAFLKVKSLEGHFRGNVRKVIVSAPVDEGDILNVVMSCNDDKITSSMRILTAASCTTNCAAPVVGAIDAALGIETGSLCTVHNVTPTQSIMDVANPGKKNDLRRARSGAVNLAPTTTGSAKAVALIFPHLKGKLNGIAVRVPCQNASITDLVLNVKRDTTVDEVNNILKAASRRDPRVLGYEERPLVSTDYVNDSRSSIVDAQSTQVINKRMVRVLAWYDNEWGYVNRMVDLAVKVVTSQSKL